MHLARMPRLTASLGEQTARWVDEKADELDRSKADIIRKCIEVVRSGEVRIDGMRTDVMQSDADDYERLRERVDELEARLADLERLNQQPGERDSDVLVNDDPAGTAASADVSSPPEPQGSDGQETVVEWVREHGPVSRSEIVSAFRDRVEERNIKPDSWWRRHAKPELEAAGFEYKRNVGWRER